MSNDCEVIIKSVNQIRYPAHPTSFGEVRIFAEWMLLPYLRYIPDMGVSLSVDQPTVSAVIWFS
jgi:hypothetical protein